jgi:hypothetical protein
MPATHTTALYILSLQRQDSLVGGKNFITLWNPVDSGKVMALGSFFVSFMATVASPAYPMRGYRITSQPTGGTLATSAEICAFDTKVFTPGAEIRYNNPTTGALDGAIFNAPPGTVKDTIGEIQQIDAPPGFNPFLVRPGEGVVMRQDVGAVGHFWNISIVWRELKG